MLVLTTPVPIIDDGKKDVKISYIYYPVWFQESQGQIRALLDSGSKINALNPAIARKLNFHTQITNFGAQKIDGSILKTFEMVIIDFHVKNKVGKPRFFQKTFLVANTKFKMILGMPFLKLSNTDVLFDKKTPTWKFYITKEALSTSEQV